MSNNSSSIIASIGTATAPFRFKQDEVLEYMQSTYSEDQAKRKLSILSRQSGILYRNSVVPDFSLTCEDPRLFTERNAPTLTKRMEVYKENVLQLSVNAIDAAFDGITPLLKIHEVTHIITVSCTGLFSPGLSTQLIEHYNLPDNTFHTAINFIGCNASFPALRLADLMVRNDDNAVVLVVCVELCTIHYQPIDNNDNILANSLFGDGSAAMIITSGSRLKGMNNRYFEIEAFNTLTLHEGKSLMAWDINPVNFEMVLSGEIPYFISKNLEHVSKSLLKDFKLKDLADIKWAVHPGGRKILDAFKNEMKLSADDLIESYQILANHGNMSSVTIIFILKEILSNSSITGNIIEMGFGPGITIESALLNIPE